VFKCAIDQAIPGYGKTAKAVEAVLLRVIRRRWWKVFSIVGWFNGNSIPFAQPAAQIDQFAPLAAEWKRWVGSDWIIDIVDRLFADGAEHDTTPDRPYLDCLSALPEDDDAGLLSGAALGDAAGFESPAGFDGLSAAELPPDFVSFAGAEAVASALAADLYASLR
jgi:hypothetical protein